jgi:ribonucleotide reductase alpha subunit
MFVRNSTFDHDELYRIVRVMVRNLNQVIDVNDYALPEAERSSSRHRPIGIGVQGLADTFQKLRLPYESKEAQQLNLEIFETIYFAALSESCELASKYGVYVSYAGSPASQGILQPDMWGEPTPDKRWNWTQLRATIKQYGLRNSLLTAPMPTAGTSQLRGNTESFEPLTSNVYVRKTKCGEFAVINPRLVADLEAIGLWPDVRESLIAAKGSVQNIKNIPQELKEIYKTVWEMKGRTLVDMARDRGRYIDQSQSLNLHMSDITLEKLTSYHFYTWKSGLKTGMYYCKTQQSLDAQASTISPNLVDSVRNVDGVLACPMQQPGDEPCVMCSS